MQALYYKNRIVIIDSHVTIEISIYEEEHLTKNKQSMTYCPEVLCIEQGVTNTRLIVEHLTTNNKEEALLYCAKLLEIIQQKIFIERVPILKLETAMHKMKDWRSHLADETKDVLYKFEQLKDIFN